jgi:hypothetical protein
MQLSSAPGFLEGGAVGPIRSGTCGTVTGLSTTASHPPVHPPPRPRTFGPTDPPRRSATLGVTWNREVLDESDRSRDTVVPPRHRLDASTRRRIRYAAVAVAPDREPSFEPWGITIRVIQVSLLAALVVLATDEPERVV